MSDTFTPFLNLTKPALDASRDTWGQKLNEDLDILDSHLLALDTNINTRIAVAIAGALPVGIVVMWSGAVNAVPAGWALCDGTNGTPDLRDRFILGAHHGRGTGDINGQFSYTVSTSVDGNHAHTGATAGHVLTEAQMPSHQHGGVTDIQGAHQHRLLNNVIGQPAGSIGGGALPYGAIGQPLTDLQGAHQHGIITDHRGGGQAHAHGIAADGSHGHLVVVPNIPPYYALAFIKRIA
jgi:hypothetical protein